MATSIRLNNNKLTNIDGLRPSLLPLLSYAGLDQLLWLDISFNEITDLNLEELLSCPNLTVLYLHKNLIGAQELDAAKAKAHKKLLAKATATVPKPASDAAHKKLLAKATATVPSKHSLRVAQPWVESIAQLGRLKRLQNLSLYANPVEDTSVFCIAKLQRAAMAQ
eukprot:SAG31_NODE_3875_length_3793_cov_1.875203_4_plen_166_part_00